MNSRINTAELVANSEEVSAEGWPQTLITELEELLVDAKLQEWRFFLPSLDLAKRILQLNEKLGEAYFEREYEQLPASREGLTSQLHEETEAPGWLRSAFVRVSNIVFQHNDDAESNSQVTLSDSETLSLFQKFISERIYN